MLVLPGKSFVAAGGGGGFADVSILVSNTGSPDEFSSRTKTALDNYGHTTRYLDIDDAVDDTDDVAIAGSALSGTQLSKYANNANIALLVCNNDWTAGGIFAGGSSQSANFDADTDVGADRNAGPDWWPAQSGATTGDTIAILSGNGWAHRGRSTALAAGRDVIATQAAGAGAGQEIIIGIPSGDTTYTAGAANSPQAAWGITQLGTVTSFIADGETLLGELVDALAGL